MTVQDLINELEKQPKDLPIACFGQISSYKCEKNPIFVSRQICKIGLPTKYGGFDPPFGAFEYVELEQGSIN